MSLVGAVTLGRLLRDYLRGPRGPRRDVAEQRLAGSWERHPSILYEPKGRRRGTLVLVHGVSARASDDPSLVRLARGLCTLGFCCETPSLPELARFRHSALDIDTLVDAIRGASDRAGDMVGIMAFSYGASYGLRAASDPRCRHRCRYLVAFGAYHALSGALEHQRELLVRSPNPELDDADLAYLRYTLLVSHREELPISVAGWHEIHEVLEHFTSDVPIAEKRAPLLRHARDVDYVDLMRRYQRRDLPPCLSPQGVLADITCGVGLLHDPWDRFVPAHHAESIRKELETRVLAPSTRVLTTPMLSHVQVAPMRNVLGLPQLVRVLDPLLGAS